MKGQECPCWTSVRNILLAPTPATEVQEADLRDCDSRNKTSTFQDRWSCRERGLAVVTLQAHHLNPAAASAVTQGVRNS